MRPPVVRARLLEAALETLVEEDLTAHALARRAGASKATVYYHFGSEAGLDAAVEGELLREMQEGLDVLRRDYPDARERLDALVDALLVEPADLTREGARRLLRFWLPRNAGRVALVRAFIDECLREGARLSLTRRVRDPARVADPILAAWMGAFTLWAGGDEVDYEAVRRALKRDVTAIVEKQRRGLPHA